MFLKISQNSQENTCARVSLLIKLLAWGLHRCFPVDFVKFSRTSFFFIEHLRRLLVIIWRPSKKEHHLLYGTTTSSSFWSSLLSLLLLWCLFLIQIQKASKNLNLVSHFHWSHFHRCFFFFFNFFHVFSVFLGFVSFFLVAANKKNSFKHGT